MNVLRLPGKIKQSKSDEFSHDFDLYLAPQGNGQPSSIGMQLPDIFQPAGGATGHGNALEGSTSFPLRKRGEDASKCRIHEVTKRLATIYKNKRMEVFHTMARTKAALRSKEFFRIYANPSESLAKKKQLFKSKYMLKLQKPKTPFSYQIEYEKLRGLRESEEELAKVQAYIDRMIAKNIKKFEEEKRKRLEKSPPKEYHYPTLQELVSFL